ncbi:MAG: hypothetical protein IH989_01470, partial [Planctomycetes bacterium]|nr:hypothetical protein [Planctomycetota bacterium]
MYSRGQSVSGFFGLRASCVVLAALMAGPVAAQERWGLADGRTEFTFHSDLRQYGLRITSVGADGSSDGVDLPEITLPFRQTLGSGITLSSGVLTSMDGAIHHDLGLALVGPGGERTLGPILLRMAETPGRFVVPYSADDPRIALILSDMSTAVDLVSRTLLLGFDRITLAPELAAALGVAIPHRVTLGSVRTEVRLAEPDHVAVGSAAETGPGTGCPGSTNPPVIGPDVIVGNLSGISNWGAIGGVSAFSVGTISCNIGDDCLKWIVGTNEHPVIAQNMYRLKNDRLEQIGMSWLKHGFTALTGNLCDSCNPPGTGALLGVGCSDPYSSSLNGLRSILGPRSQVNAHTGLFTFPRDIPNVSCIGCSTIDRRLQVHNEDLDNPGALYFVEAQYVALDDAGWGHGNNNASYRPMFFIQPRCDFNLQTSCESDADCTGPGRCATNLAATCESDSECPGAGLCEINASIFCDTGADCPIAGEACIKCRPDACGWPSSCPASIPLDGFCATVSGSTRREQAAIRAWRDHDASVVETDVQIPGEGLLLLAAKAVAIGGGRWRYEYAVQNLNSDRGAGSFSIPLPTGAVVDGVGFHDVDYHSGEPYAATRCMTCETTPSVTCSSASDCPNAGDRCLSDDSACPGAVCGSVCSGGINDGASCL